MKNYIEIQTIEFNHPDERLQTSNYGRQGFYIAKLVAEKVDINTSDLVFVDPQREQVLFICPANLIEDMGLMEQFSDKNKSEMETLVAKNECLLNENKNLRTSFFTIEEKLKNKNENLLPVLHSENSGISEAFVLNLVKMLTGNKI